MHQHQITVIGSGVIGMATTLALRERGLDVACLEAEAPGAGQSKGPVRIFRFAHVTPALTSLAVQARAGWARWEVPLERSLIGDQGVVLTGRRAVAERRNLAADGLPHKVLAPAEAEAQAGLVADSGELLVRDESGGVICVGAIMKYLEDQTAEQRTIARVEAIERRADGFDLLTADGVWRTERIVICAGQGTPPLALSVGLDLQADFYRHSRFGFPMSDPTRRPACLMDDDGDEQIYGLTIGSSGRYAVGLLGETDYPVERFDAEEASRLSLPRLQAHIARRLPHLSLEPEVELQCTFQRSALLAGGDELGVWQLDGATICFGNNLYKFAPLLGEMLADAAMSGVVPEPLRAAA